jgi:adenylate kinase family enzyme
LPAVSHWGQQATALGPHGPFRAIRSLGHSPVSRWASTRSQPQSYFHWSGAGFFEVEQHQVQRVVIIGSPGAGKSTLARALALRAGLPPVHLDAHFWQPGWTTPSIVQWHNRLDTLVAEPHWIIDGNYGSALVRALPRADTALWLDPPRRTALWRAARRHVTSDTTTRPDRAQKCQPKMDAEFLRYIWHFKTREHPRLENALSTYGAHLTPVIIRHHSDAEAFLASVIGLQEPA